MIGARASSLGARYGILDTRLVSVQASMGARLVSAGTVTAVIGNCVASVGKRATTFGARLAILVVRAAVLGTHVAVPDWRAAFLGRRIPAFCICVLTVHRPSARQHGRVQRNGAALRTPAPCVRAVVSTHTCPASSVIARVALQSWQVTLPS